MEPLRCEFEAVGSLYGADLQAVREDVIGLHLKRARSSYDNALGKPKTGPGNLLTQFEELKSLGAKTKKALPAPGDE